MAEIVLGLAAAHGGPTTTPASRWPQQTGETDPRIDYEMLLRTAKARPEIQDEITPEKMQERYDFGQQAIAQLREILLDARPDSLVVFGDDQHEHLLDDNMPQFCIYRGEWLPVYRRAGKEKRDAANIREYPACPELAEQLIRYLTDQEFDVAVSNKLRPGVGLGHAFTFLYDQMRLDGSIPTIPFMINTFYPPNQPTPKRCYALGQAVRAAIEAWPERKRVAVMASGGLSHTIIDEEIDHVLIDAMLEKDAGRLCSLPVERLNLGTSENRNWIVEAGAMEPLTMTVIGYEPCYRSPAGTGCAIAFAYWK